MGYDRDRAMHEQECTEEMIRMRNPDKPIMPTLRMDAYYYGFAPTGVVEIDLILSAVACAGKAFHHTDDWTTTTEPYNGHTGACPIDWIQNAANDAARAFKAKSAVNPTVKD